MSVVHAIVKKKKRERESYVWVAMYCLQHDFYRRDGNHSKNGKPGWVPSNLNHGHLERHPKDSSLQPWRSEMWKHP